jgi:methyltransferase (TIGR00027 family)
VTEGPRPAPVENISDTARWVAAYRAMETERADAHFKDPYARLLAGDQGERILAAMKNGRSSAWAFVVRTCVFDELLLRAVAEAGVDTVVNLAAGLDARPWRLSLPPSLRWIEVDLPGILSYKQQRLAGARPVCAFESVRLDLSDVAARRELFARVGAGAKNVIVLTEGLLVYLTPEQVGELASDLHAQPSFRRWVLDIVSPDLLKWLQKSYGRQLADAGAPLRFAPAEGTRFYEKFGWKTAEFRSTFDEGQRLKREMKGAWLFRLLMRFASAARREKLHQMGGIVLLERT